MTEKKFFRESARRLIPSRLLRSPERRRERRVALLLNAKETFNFAPRPRTHCTIALSRRTECTRHGGSVEPANTDIHLVLQYCTRLDLARINSARTWLQPLPYPRRVYRCDKHERHRASRRPRFFRPPPRDPARGRYVSASNGIRWASVPAAREASFSRLFFSAGISRW